MDVPKKKKLLIFGAVLLILIFLGFFLKDSFYFFYCNHVPVLSENHPAAVRDCYRSLGTQEKDVSMCKKITKTFEAYGWSMKDDCLLGVAEGTKNPLVCEESGRRDSCITMLVLDDILLDSEYCSTLSNSPVSFANDCYHHLGILLNRTDLCNKISPLDTKGTCLFWIAKNTNNVSVCGEIFEESRRDYCIEKVSQ